MAIAVAAVVAVNAPAHAAVQDIMVLNASGDLVERLQFQPISSTRWGVTQLQRGYLLDGDRTKVTFDAYRSYECIFDMKVMFEDGREVRRDNLDLCTTSQVTIQTNYLVRH
jgi:hypothetical protein